MHRIRVQITNRSNLGVLPALLILLSLHAQTLQASDLASPPPPVRELLGAEWQPVQQEALRYSYEPLTYSKELWYGSTFWTGPDWTRVGRDWQHSGQQVNSVRVFNAPKAGKARITGRAYKADTKCGDGVVVAIRHGGRTVWQAEIDAADTTGAQHEVAVELARGDALRFVLARHGEITCDTTYWDPTIAYADGTTYRASEGFSDEVGVWSYEMETDHRRPAGLPEGWQAVQWRSPDGQRGVLWVSRGESETPEGAARFLDLVPGETYRVRDAEGRDEGSRTGDDLMREGLRVALPYGGQLVLAYEVTDVAPFTAPPTSPSALRAAADGPGAIGLSWQAAEPPSCYVIWRDGDVAAVVAARTEYVDRPPHAGVPHRYAVQAERGFLRSAPVRAAVGTSRRPELDLWEMVEDDWLQSDRLDEAAADWQAAAGKTLSAAQDLADRLRASHRPDLVQPELNDLSRLRARHPALDPQDRDAQRDLYLQARWLKREISLSDPLLQFGKLLFAKRVPTEYSHLVMQYFGWRARPGGGLFVLEEPGRSLKARNILRGQLEGGSVFAPCLSWDRRRVLFSYSHCTEQDPYFHICEAGTDGTGLRQLTSGPYEDLMPAYLPDGGIIFSSTRRRGYARCFGGQFGDRWHVYTLHRMDPDGRNIRTLSFHETNEWFPTILNDGSVAYARWDYVDRHAVLHQNLWRTNPDGSGPATLWGNHTQNPHCSFEAQAIPGSRKIICTASAHHSITAGSIIIIDPGVDYDGQAAIDRVTPEVRFPEAEGWPSSYYATPWPLSEDLYLVSYSHRPLIPEPKPNDTNAFGVYLLDRWGNRELLYRDPDIGSTNPIPLRLRPVPPVLPDVRPETDSDEGTFVLLDVYDGLPGIPRGEVKALRVIQVLPKATPVADSPPVGLAGQEPTRMVLGTVPVEADGSAHFSAPARKPLLFQALDERGLAIHTMRSITYLQPGETVSCIGCHEPRNTTPTARDVSGIHAPPSVIRPGPGGCAPFSYPRLVQPVLDRHCISCHGDEEPEKGLSLTGTVEAPWTRSYLALTGGRTFYQGDTNAGNASQALVPRYGGWNPVHDTPVGGLYGSRGSRLVQMLLAGHEDVELDAESIERLAIWIDSNALFYGTYDPAEQAKQLRSEVIDVPPLQ